jgi:LacI family transcriptional regulator
MSLSNESNNDDHIKRNHESNILVMFDKIAKLSKCSKAIIDDQRQLSMPFNI